MSGIGVVIRPVTRLLLEEENIGYCASVYYLRKGENQIDIHFVITKELESHVTVC